MNLGSSDLERLEGRKEPWEMNWREFSKEFDHVMKAVAEKEQKGALDPNKPNYRIVTPQEHELLNADWKQFSRQRGFSSEDIQEYGRWLALSGQRDGLEGAINDPWRRNRTNHKEKIYIGHIENAQRMGKPMVPAILRNCENLKGELASYPNRNLSDVPVPGAQKSGSDDVW